MTQERGERICVVSTQKPAVSVQLLALLIVFLDPAIATADSFDASFSTFIGSFSDAIRDSVEAVDTDVEGNLYIGGNTRSDFTVADEVGVPTTPGSLLLPSSQPANNPCTSGCGYVIKLTTDQELVYGALLPELRVKDIAVAPDGGVVFAGAYEGRFGDAPVTPGAFADDGTNGNTFVGKVSPDGSTQEYGAVFRANEVYAVEVDSDGNAYFVGDVLFPGLPTTPDSVKPEFTTGGNATPSNGFLLKVNPTGTELLFGTHLGGDGTDVSFGLTLDGAGGALVVGTSNSTELFGFPARTPGVEDATIIQVSSDGTEVLDVAFIGGNGQDNAEAITPNPLGGYTVVGRTSSSDFPVSTDALQTRMLGSTNGFIALVDEDLNITAATYFGGTVTGGLLDVVMDESGNAYFVGTTFSADIPVTDNGFQDLSSVYTTSYFGNSGRGIYPADGDLVREAFFGAVSADLTRLVYSSYLGGSVTVPRGFDALSFGSTIARSPGGAVYVGGNTQAEDFPTTSDAIQDGFLGLSDGFVVEFSSQAIEITSPTALPAAPAETNYTYQLEASGGVPPYTWDLVGFKLPDGLALSSDGVISGLTALNQSEPIAAYQFSVEVTDTTGSTAHKTLFIRPLSRGIPICEPNQCRLDTDIENRFVFSLPFPARGVPPFTLDVIGELPDGVVIFEFDGTFEGQLAEAGSYNFGFTVTGSFGVAATKNWTVVVVDPNPPPPAPPANPPPSGGGGSGGGGGALTVFEVLFLCSVALVGGMRSSRKRRPLRVQ